MGSFADYQTRAAELRRQAETAHDEKIRADLTHLAERFEKLSVSSTSADESESRLIKPKEV